MPEAHDYRFHGNEDREVRSFRWDKTEQRASLGTIIIQKPKLNYQFYTHFHPYVDELVRRLIEKSVRGLQAIDTEYKKPDSVRVTRGKTTKLRDGTEVIRPTDTEITLPASTEVTLPNGKSVKLPDSIVTTSLSGTQN